MPNRREIVEVHPELMGRYIPVCGEIVELNEDLAFCIQSPFQNIKNDVVLVMACPIKGSKTITVNEKTPIYHGISLNTQLELIEKCNLTHNNFYMDLIVKNPQFESLRTEYLIAYHKQKEANRHI